MSGTNVSNMVIDRLFGALPSLSPEARNAAVHALETLLSCVIAAAGPEFAARVEKFHARRFALGPYSKDPTP